MLSRVSHALRRAVASSGTAGATAHSLIPRRLLVASAPSSAVADKAMGAVRHDWTNAEVEALYDRPLLDLVYDAASVHRANHDPTAGPAVHVCSPSRPADAPRRATTARSRRRGKRTPD